MNILESKLMNLISEQKSSKKKMSSKFIELQTDAITHRAQVDTISTEMANLARHQRALAAQAATLETKIKMFQEVLEECNESKA